MSRSCLAVFVAAICLVVASPAGAQSRPYPFGEPPYRIDSYYEPEIANGCWKWNWQQHQWDNYCPVYVQPKAFMYPRTLGAVLRTKG